MEGELGDASSIKSVGAAAAVAVTSVLAAAAYLVGIRKGKKKTTIVEIKRI